MKLIKLGVVLGMLLCAGCSSNEEKDELTYVNCKMGKSFNIMDVESNVKIFYDGDKVLRTVSDELVTLYESDDVSEEEMTAYVEELVKSYEEQKKQFEKEEEISFDYEVKDSEISLTTKIDYNKVDLKELLKINPDLESVIVDDYFDISKLKNNYELQGFVCTDLQ